MVKSLVTVSDRPEFPLDCDTYKLCKFCHMYCGRYLIFWALIGVLWGLINKIKEIMQIKILEYSKSSENVFLLF